MAHRETAIHRGAFETFYASERSVVKTAESCGVSETALRNWATWFSWHARADARDQEAARQAERAAIQRRAKTLAEHQRLGELLRRRSEQHFQKHEIESTADAIRAAKEGIAIERLAEGLPGFIAELMNYDEDQLRAERDRLLRRLPAALDRPTVSGEGEAEPEAEREDDGSDPVLPARPDAAAGAVP